MDTTHKSFLAGLHLAVALAVLFVFTTPLKGFAQSQPARDSNDEITQRQVAEMDRFLDSHPEIAEQLQKDPSLIDNKEFVAKHPALGEYLQEHPHVQESFTNNPNAFMHREDRYERHEGEGYGRGDDRDITHREVAEMDRFLDSHPEIAEQLKKDPSLVDNREFVRNHPALQEYLKEHPHVAEAYREHPNEFMRDENRYDRHEDRMAYDRDRDRDRREMGSFGEFLRGHSGVADQLSKDPTLANNKEYLESHPELREYLNSHPAMQQQLASNPHAVMSSPGVATTPPAKNYTPEMKPPKDKSTRATEDGEAMCFPVF